MQAQIQSRAPGINNQQGRRGSLGPALATDHHAPSHLILSSQGRALVTLPLMVSPSRGGRWEAEHLPKAAQLTPAAGDGPGLLRLRPIPRALLPAPPKKASLQEACSPPSRAETRSPSSGRLEQDSLRAPILLGFFPSCHIPSSLRPVVPVSEFLSDHVQTLAMVTGLTKPTCLTWAGKSGGGEVQVLFSKEGQIRMGEFELISNCKYASNLGATQGRGAPRLRWF